jgi:hypothetical protein
VKLVVQVKLLPSADQAGALQTTLHAANAAANQVSQVAYEKKFFRNFALRKHTYQDIRAAGLGSQAAQHVIKKATYIRWMVALRENPGGCGSGRAGAAAALRPGFVLGWALAGGTVLAGGP